MGLSVAFICSGCDNGLPVWQQLILGVVGVAIAFGLLYALYLLVTLSTRRRDARLRECFLGVQDAWPAPDAAERISPFVTRELHDRLAWQLAESAAKGQTIHHERPRLERLTVLSGGGKHDRECLARIESSVRNWLTDESGALVGGSRDRSYDTATWHFVRGEDRSWIAAEVEFIRDRETANS